MVIAWSNQVNLQGWFKEVLNDDGFVITLTDTISPGNYKVYRSSDLTVGDYHYVLPVVDKVEIFNEINDSAGAQIMVCLNIDLSVDAVNGKIILLNPGSYYVIDRKVNLFSVFNNDTNTAVISLVFHTTSTPIAYKL